MKKILLLFLGLIFLVGIADSTAQSKKITGKVTSTEDGSALPGVSVQVKSTTRGTQTDANGEYAIEVSPSETLSFSFIGLVPLEKLVGNQTVINITMTSSDKFLNEIVVVGYGQ